MHNHLPPCQDQLDPLLDELSEYVSSPPKFSQEAYTTASDCMMDALGCGLLALSFPACVRMMGGVVPGSTLTDGARVPGTPWQFDPVQAAFNIGCMVRWLDYNDTWLAAEWGHPSDNFGAILSLADYLDRNPRNAWTPGKLWRIEDVLQAAIIAYEIQGGLALANSFNRQGFDHVLLVRVASTAVACSMLGGDRSQIADALSHAWLDGGALRTYRHAPNTGSRKSWAAGDATRRGVQLALWTMTGEMGYRTPLTAKRWGFQDVMMGGKELKLVQPLGCYTMENILFKVSFPAEFHAQTAAEAAIRLSDSVRNKLDSIKRIRIHTHESAVRIIDKKGPLNNPADRDHCIQYIVAVSLLFGGLTADHYEDQVAADPRIDALRDKMQVIEDPRYTQDYLAPDSRSIANRLEIEFNDGSPTLTLEVIYPIGHRRRRSEARPLLYEKFRDNSVAAIDEQVSAKLLQWWQDPESFSQMRVSHWLDTLATQSDPLRA
ncbi:MAG: bifunctional 2-methylcitrate dehydratase/aconitate hydratase [Pirellula sp.]